MRRSLRKVTPDKLPVLLVNDKPKPGWPKTVQSYPLDVLVERIQETWVGYGDTYRVRVRYERHDGDIVTEYHQRQDWNDVQSMASAFITMYHPADCRRINATSSDGSLNPEEMALLQELRGE